MNLLIARDLHQLDATLAPSPKRLHPVARTQLVLRLEIAELPRIALALDEAEAARVLVNEAVHAQLTRIGERAPQPLSLAGLRKQAIAVVHLGAVVIEAPAGGVRTVEKHRGQGRDFQLCDRATQIQRQYLDQRDSPGSDCKIRPAALLLSSSTRQW